MIGGKPPGLVQCRKVHRGKYIMKCIICGLLDEAYNAGVTLGAHPGVVYAGGHAPSARHCA